MSYFRKLLKLQSLLDLFSRDESWLILINADPDAMSSAMALRRIMKHRVADSAIAKVNEINRPDNLALVRYSRLHMHNLTPDLLKKYQRFAIVDSQPSHHAMFANIPFSIIIDHHPLPDHPCEAAYCIIRPEYGATSTIMTEHLYNLGIRPGQLLSTAMQFGIKTDTGNFQRHFTDVDLRAYNYLARFANQQLLARIVRSEFRKPWLSIFARACINMHKAGTGEFVYVGEVESPDVLVGIADFFMRVYEIRWVAVNGMYAGNSIIIFRGDGVTKDLGAFAAQQFGDIGSAGGHRSMARAEFPISAASGTEMELFAYKRIMSAKRKQHVLSSIAPKKDMDVFAKGAKGVKKLTISSSRRPVTVKINE